MRPHTARALRACTACTATDCTAPHYTALQCTAGLACGPEHQEPGGRVLLAPPLTVPPLIVPPLNVPQVSRAAQNIKSLAGVLVAAIPGFGNVLALIGLVLYMYAYVGVILFRYDMHGWRYSL